MDQSVGRRQLFNKGFQLIRRSPGSLEFGEHLAPNVVLHPPGAVEEAELRGTYTNYGLCAAACPQAVIRLLDPRVGKLQGTPAIIHELQPCLWCPDFPCVDACPEGILTRENIPLGIGIARMDSKRCLLSAGYVV